MAQKGIGKSIVIFILFAAAITGTIVYKKIATRNSLAAQIAALRPRGAPPKTVEDLRKAIDLYGKKIDEHMTDIGRVGIYWKILGSRLMDGQRPLYGEALEALTHAVHYYPEDESIHYLIGVAASNVATAEYVSLEKKAEHYRIAEAAYLQAIHLHERYARALYGLGVLYVYELGRPEDAIPHMERYLDISKNDTDGMSVLAAARYLTEDYAAAIDLYDRIIGATKNREIQIQAELLKQQVMNEWYR